MHESLVVFFSPALLGWLLLQTCTHTLGPCGPVFRVECPGQLILKLQKAAVCLPCSVSSWTLGGATGQHLKLLTFLNYLSRSTDTVTSTFSFISVVLLCIRDMKHGLNYLMACTVSAQTLKTRCCCVLSSKGVNLSATSGYACQNPSPAPYLCPSTSIIPASLWPLLTSPVTVLVVPRHVITMMSPLCLLNFVSVLAFCTSVWSPGVVKSMVEKEGLDQKKKNRDRKRTILARGLWGLHHSVSVVNAVVVVYWCWYFNVFAKTRRLGIELNGVLLALCPPNTDQHTHWMLKCLSKCA